MQQLLPRNRLKSLLLLLLVFPVCAEDSNLIRGSEPTREELIPGFSEIYEPTDLKINNRVFSGESIWRFRSNNPSSATRPYLYNRTELGLSLSQEQKISSSFVFLRRDTTSSGKSELPINHKAFSKNYFIRHAAFSWQNSDFQIHAGDFLLGWGQGLGFNLRQGDAYRPFLYKDAKARIQANTSSYENRGLRGVAVSKNIGDSKIILGFGSSPLDGRLSDNGAYIEDLRTLSDRFYGELSRTLDIERRDVLTERLGFGRWETTFKNSFLGFGFAWTRYSHDVLPQPNISQDQWPNRWEWAFQGKAVGLLSFDAKHSFNEESTVFTEQALSLWGNHQALAMMLGCQKNQTKFGLFYFDPFYFWRLSDGLRLESDSTANRRGFFMTHFKALEKHRLGFQFYTDQNIKSEFSGSASSHQPPDSRFKSWVRLDDEMKLSRLLKIYGRSDVSREPYFVDAQDDPRVKNIWEFKERLEATLEAKPLKTTFGFDHARLITQGLSGGRGYGWDTYVRSNLKLSPKVSFYSRVLYFKLGEALFSNRFVYLSNPEIYWREISLSTIVYESLFASYEPQGVRLSFALEITPKDFSVIWFKLGNTNFLGPVAAKDRWDFKTEVAFKW